MKRFMLAALCLTSVSIFAQEREEHNYIEINAEVEKKVTPDEIYIFISIEERYDGKDKISIEEQEKKLKKALTAKGIDTKALKLWDALSQYQKVKWYGKKDALATSEYSLMVSTADEAKVIFEILADQQIENAHIYKTDYSKKQELKKELRIEAMKRGKAQADYMLEAIGEKTGKPMIIREQHAFVLPYRGRYNVGLANQLSYNEEAKFDDGGSTDFNDMTFTMNIYIKFEIAE